MNGKWTSAVVAGTVLVLIGGQAMAQPWGGGRGQGMGRMGRGPMMQGMGQGGGPGAWCPLGAGPGSAQGLGQFGLGRGFARRLNLSNDQMEKIRDIVAESREQTLGKIKDVLTEDQKAQLKQMQENAGRFNRGGMGPGMGRGFRGPAGPGFRQGRGFGMGPRGGGFGGQPFAGGPGRGWGMRPGMGMNRPDAAGMQPPTDVQGDDQGPVLNRRVPPLEQMFDQADTNHDGALTKDEIRAFHEKMGPGLGRQGQ